MSKELILEILKTYYSYGSDYICGETDTYYYAEYFNDYPMQHGYGIEIRYYKITNKIRAYQGGYRYRHPEQTLNEILWQKKQ